MPPGSVSQRAAHTHAWFVWMAQDFIWDTNARTKVYPTLLAKLDAASKQRFLGFHETMVQALPLQFQHSDVQRLVQGLTTSP